LVPELMKPFLFLAAGRDHQLAADFMGDAVLPAKVDHLPDAGDRQARLERARLIVESGVEHPAVVGALVAARPGFLFKHDNLRGGVGLEKAIGSGQADDSASDDDDPGCHVPARLVRSVESRREQIRARRKLWRNILVGINKSWFDRLPR
jgi:hypothetical protein